MTVLFTDIVDSTATAARLGDRDWGEVLQRHNDIVRRQLALHRGREVKTTGDGFLASFDGPGRAIHCATAIQDGLAGLGIEMRAALHTGECEQRDADLSGIAVHLAARILDRAQAGEGLVSSTVKDLVVGSSVDFEDRGEQELKGVPGSWRLFAVRTAAGSMRG